MLHQMKINLLDIFCDVDLVATYTCNIFCSLIGTGKQTHSQQKILSIFPISDLKTPKIFVQY
jgi:hypothetical protein